MCDEQQPRCQYCQCCALARAAQLQEVGFDFSGFICSVVHVIDGSNINILI